MSTQKLFDDDSDEDVAIKIENDYAKKYDSWREKEELHKLEQKYGSKALDPNASASSDSEDESDEPPEVSEEMEQQFLKTLALLKTKDPRIYEPTFKCFDDEPKKIEEKKPATKTLTFEDSDDESDNDGNIFKVEKKAEIFTEKEPGHVQSTGSQPKEAKIKDYLTGKVEHVDDKVERDLAPLKALWSDPKLNDGEAFLRDYILNKRYLEDGEVGDAEERLRDDEALEEDEKRVEEQGQFERAYNFRFEEPDQEFLKRFPRTMNYVRPKDDSRARKRKEMRARKDDEKHKRMEEIARMKALKLKEIHEKIAKIKEVTGNQDLAFEEADIEGEFDPDEHDRRMRALFDDEYYGEADDHKPVFPDLDEELEIENWDKFETEVDEESAPAHHEGGGGDGEGGGDGPHCEDDDFNMDAEYDPKQARANLLEQIQSTLGKKRRNRKKKSKLAKLLEQDKPKFVPSITEKTYREYMEEYYKMDCEDVIGGDLPTRFKYREVVPNDFGLSVEEILLADDRELTQWVPLKKLVRHRPAEVEKSEVNTYRAKASDERLKRKILPSLFKDLPEEPEIVVPIEQAKKKRKKKKNKEKSEKLDQNEGVIDEIEPTAESDTSQNSLKHSKERKTKKTVGDNEENQPNDEGNTDHNSENVEGAVTKKKKKRRKDSQNSVEITDQDANFHVNKSIENTDTKKTKTKENEIVVEQNKDHSETVEESNESIVSKKNIKRRTNSESNVELHKDETQSSASISKKNKKRRQDSQSSYAVSIEKKDDETIGAAQIVKNHSKQIPNQSTILNGETKKKKKQNSDGFIVENVPIQAPSKVGHNKNTLNNKKRKLDAKSYTQKKKNNVKKFKKGFKPQDKDKSENPLSKLSDERLKAYGLNPKKYRSFLKYKKF